MSLLNLILAAALSGSPTSFNDTYVKCIDSASKNSEWAECGEVYLKDLDSTLNSAWKEAFRTVGERDPKSRDQFLNEQRAWLKFRDASCQFYASGAFGREGEVLHFYGCRGAIISARIAELKAIVDDAR